MGSERLGTIALVLLTIVAVPGARAQLIRPAYAYPGGSSSERGPATLQVGDTPLFFTPYAGFAAGHDDNVLLSHTNERSSTLYVASPGFKVDARSPNSVFQARYQGQVGRFANSQDDDYVDHDAAAQYDIAFSGRSFLRLGYGYIRGHDPRGSTDRPVEGSPDKYRVSAPNATFSFGAPGAPGRLELYYAEADRTYLNNRATTEVSDRDTKEYGGAFYVRVMPKTYALAEVRQTDIGYKLRNSADGQERRYFGGVSWEATAATTGTIKVGQLKRTFDSDLPTTSATSWEGIVAWAPRSYSVFELRTARQTTESTGLGSFILTSVTAATWTHSWNSQLSTSALLRYQKDQYQNFDRTDETKSIGLKVGYRFRRWLTLGAEYTFTRRDSNSNSFDYDKNVYLLTATGSL